MRRLVVLLLLLSLAYALPYVRVYRPIPMEDASGKDVYAGKINAGHVLEVVVSKDSGLSYPWDRINVRPPLNWNVEIKEDPEKFYVYVHVPRDERGTKRVEFTLSNSDNNITAKTFFVSFIVDTGLLQVYTREKGLSCFVGKDAEVEVVIINDTVGKTVAEVEWGEKKQVEVDRGQRVVKLKKKYDYVGEYRERVIVRDLGSGDVYEREFKVVVLPDLSSKFRVVLVGLPFIDPVSLPVRFLLSFLP